MHVDRLRASSPRRRDVFQAHPSVSLSHSVSDSSVNVSVHDQTRIEEDSVDIEKEPRALLKIEPNSTGHDDFLYRIYESRGRDRIRYGQNMVLQNQTRLKAKATLGMVLNGYYGIPHQMHTATHQGNMFVHARSGTLHSFVTVAQAFTSSERDIYLSFYANEPSEAPQGTRVLAARVLFTL